MILTFSQSIRGGGRDKAIEIFGLLITALSLLTVAIYHLFLRYD